MEQEKYKEILKTLVELVKGKRFTKIQKYEILGTIQINFEENNKGGKI